MGDVALKPAGGDPANFDGTHIQFRLVDFSPSGKTRVWAITAKGDGAVLGGVAWFGRWRRYCFFSNAGCVFEQVCLREIAAFIEDRTTEHKRGT